MLDTLTTLLTGRESTLHFATKELNLDSGTTLVTLFNPVSQQAIIVHHRKLIKMKTPLPGTFIAQGLETRMGNIVFSTSLKVQDARRSALQRRNLNPKIIRLHKDESALSVKIEQPESGVYPSSLFMRSSFSISTIIVMIGGPQKLLVVVSTGRNDVQELKLRFSSPEINIQMKSGYSDRMSRQYGQKFRECVLNYFAEQITSLSFSDDCVTVKNLSKESDLRFLLPYKSSGLSAVVRIILSSSELH